MSNQLKNLYLCYQLLIITDNVVNVTNVKIPLIEEEKLIPLTQCSLLVKLNLKRSLKRSRMGEF